MLKAGGKDPDAVEMTNKVNVTFKDGRPISIRGTEIGTLDIPKIKEYQAMWLKKLPKGFKKDTSKGGLKYRGLDKNGNPIYN